MCKRHGIIHGITKLVLSQRPAAPAGPVAVPQGEEGAATFAFFKADGCINRVRHAHREYLGGRLPEELCVLIDRHLFDCHECSSFWDALSEDVWDGLETVVEGPAELTAEERFDAGDAPQTWPTLDDEGDEGERYGDRTGATDADEPALPAEEKTS